MADITYAELKKRVGQKLGLVMQSEDLDSGDESEISKRCLSVQQQLDFLSVATFNVEQGLEEAYSDAFADLAAAECADVFELQEPHYSQIASQRLGRTGRSDAERRMRAFFVSRKQQTISDATVV